MHKKLVLTILIVIFLTYGLILAIFSHSGFPQAMSTNLLMPYLADKPVGEDGFYILTVAWNLAAQYKLAYNFNQITTGIQPLITFIYAFFAWIVQFFNGDKWIFIRVVLAFNIINLIMFAHVLGIIAKTLIPNNAKENAWVYIFTVIITLFNCSLFCIFCFGLETGIYLIFIAICLLYTLRFSSSIKPSYRQAIVFGVLAGFTGLSRIDFGVIFLCFLGFLVLYQRAAILWSLISGFIALLIVGPWLCWVYAVTGSWVPSSGISESGVITLGNALDRTLIMTKAVIYHFNPWYYAGGRYLNILALVSCLIIFIIIFYRKSHFQLLETIDSAGKKIFFYWIFALIPLGFIYPFFFSSTHFYSRYISPLLVVFLPVLGITLNKLLKKSPDYLRAAVLLSFPICFFIGAFLHFHTGRIGHTQTVAAGFIKQEFPCSIKIGALQSGIIGFFNENVVNLDGKMNHDVLKLTEMGLTLPDYLDKEKIDVIVEWDYYLYWISYNEKDYFTEKWKKYPRKIPDGKTGCIVRKNIIEPNILRADL